MGRQVALAIAGIALLLPATGAAWPAEASAATAAPPRTLHTAAVVPHGAWTTYHNDDARTGYDPSAPAITNILTTPGWTLTTLDGQVYAEPLVFNGIVYAATLNDTVYALNQIDGSLVWSKHLGTPQTAGWGCGNISPTGILGTPVIDTAANRIYAVAEVVNAGVTTYHLFGLDLGSSGNIVLDATLTTTGLTGPSSRRGAPLP